MRRIIRKLFGLAGNLKHLIICIKTEILTGPSFAETHANAQQRWNLVQEYERKCEQLSKTRSYPHYVPKRVWSLSKKDNATKLSRQKKGKEIQHFCREYTNPRERKGDSCKRLDSQESKIRPCLEQKFPVKMIDTVLKLKFHLHMVIKPHTGLESWTVSTRLPHDSPRAKTCTFEGPGRPKHQNSTRRPPEREKKTREDPRREKKKDTRSRERKKERKSGRKSEKQARNFGPPTRLGPPILWALTFGAPTLWALPFGPPTFGPPPFGPHPSGHHPSSEKNPCRDSENKQIRVLLERQREQILAGCQAERDSKTRVPGWLWPRKYTKIDWNDRVSKSRNCSCSCKRRTTSTRSTTSSGTIITTKSASSWSSCEKVSMRWKNWSDFKGLHSMNFREEDWSKIETLSLNSLARYRNCKMKSIVWMIREIFKMLNQYAVDNPTLPVNQCFSHLIQYLKGCWDILS